MKRFIIMYCVCAITILFLPQAVCAGGTGGYKGEACRFQWIYSGGGFEGKIMCGHYHIGWCSGGCNQSKNSSEGTTCSQIVATCQTSGDDGYGHSFKELKKTSEEWLTLQGDFVPWPTKETNKKTKDLIQSTAQSMCDDNCCNK